MIIRHCVCCREITIRAVHCYGYCWFTMQIHFTAFILLNLPLKNSPDLSTIYLRTVSTNMCYKIILDMCVIVGPCFRIYIWNVILNEYGSFRPLVSAYNATGCRLAVVVVTLITHEVFLIFICRLVVVMLIMQSPQINPAARPRHRLRERCRPMGRTRNPSLTESCRMGWMGCPTGSCHAQ